MRLRPAAKVLAKAKPKAKAGAKAAPKARVRGMALRLPRMRKPASRQRRGQDGGLPMGVDYLAKWKAGEIVPVQAIPLETLLSERRVVAEEAYYYHQECRVAAKILGVQLSGDMTMLRLSLTGTNSEAVLRVQSGQPTMEFRGHPCPAGCNAEVVADDIIHLYKIRKQKEKSQEEGWVTNLGREPVDLTDGVDELTALRARSQALGGLGARGDVPPHPGKEREDVDEDESSKKKKKKKKKKEKKKEKKSKEKKAKDSDTSEEEVPLDGTKCKQASVKKPQLIFGGTGMDFKEKVRKRVARRARKKMNPSKEKATSGSGSTDSSGSTSDQEEADESVFAQATKVKRIADQYPGILGSQALAQMRNQLLSGIGEDDKPGRPSPVCMQYFRQVLQRKATPPVQRELLTISSMVDLMIRGKIAQAVDVGVQRIKSQELVLSGCHWNVAQRVEVLAQEAQALAAAKELQEAQREVANDHKVRMMAANSDGQNHKGGKNMKKGDGKEDGKNDYRRKGGKGQGNKGDPGKKQAKDDGTPKA